MLIARKYFQWQTIIIVYQYPVLRYSASVPLGISYSQEDTLTLTAFDFEGIPEETGIFLEDNHAKYLA